MSANNKGQNVANAPLLRFPEFKDEWNIVKVSDLLEFYSTNSYSWDQLDFEVGEIFNLHYGMIHNGLPTMMNAKENILPFVKEKPKNYTICKEGDVAFADASEDTNDVAKCIEFTNCDRKQIICGLHTIHGRDKLGITELGYKGYAFSSKAFHDQVKKLAQGTKIYSISAKTFSECFVGIPSNKEQQKIAKLLSLLDRRIEIQRSAIEKLKSLMAGIRKSIFDGKSRNETLGNIASIYQPQTISSSDLETSGLYPVYGANGIIGRYSKYNHESEQVIITCRGNTCGTVNYSSQKSWITGNSMVINCDDATVSTNKRYLFHYLSYCDFSSIISGSGQPQIVREPLIKYKIYVPSPSKQSQIAKLLDCYMKQIENCETILCLYIQQKQFLLSKMFI